MNRKKLLWTLVAIVSALVLLFSLLRLWQQEKPAELPPEVPSVEPPQEEAHSKVEEEEEEAVPVVLAPEDFAPTMERYPDVYAWLSLPGTRIDYPIVQRFGDDSYYVQRDLDGKHDPAGTLFTEYQYNSKSFEDPVTIIYGHHMRNGSMFGDLQSHMLEKPLGEEDQIYVYLPDTRKTYQIFAAVPFDNSHILYYHDFQDPQVFGEFFGEICNTRSLSANIREDLAPEVGDQVLILSTCLAGNNKNRFLVLGVLTEECSIN